MSKRQRRTDSPGSASTDILDDHIDVGTIPDGAIVTAVDSGRILDANAAAGALFHCSADALIGRSVSALLPGEQRAASVGPLERALEEGRIDSRRDGTPLTVEALDGDRVPVELNASRGTAAGDPYILSVFREASERVARRTALEETRTRLSTLLDALPVPVTVLDTDGRVRRWNQAAEDTFGYAAESVIGDLYPLFVDEAEFGTALAGILDGGILNGYETTHRARDGSRIRVELYARPLYEGGELTGLIGAAVDISARTRRSQQLDVLYRVLRHNLRNELTVIQGLADRVENSAGTQQSGPPAAARISEASQRLIDLSDQANRIQSELQARPQTTGSISIETFVSDVVDATPESAALTLLPGAEDPGAETVPSPASPAVRELIEEIAAHGPGDSHELSVALQSHDLLVEIESGGPVLPPGSQMLISEGQETALQHGHDLCVAKAYFLIRSIGGEISFPEGSDATTLRIEVPRERGTKTP